MQNLENWLTARAQVYIQEHKTDMYVMSIHSTSDFIRITLWTSSMHNSMHCFLHHEIQGIYIFMFLVILGAMQ